jgi:AcrR family transcriptional regulator
VGIQRRQGCRCCPGPPLSRSGISSALSTIDRLLPAGSRKRQIVETVLELVTAQGTEAISFQLVADAIGVTQPAVFRHFPTKEAMWLAVMDWLEERLVEIYSAVDEDPGQPNLVVLGRMFLRHVRLIERYPALAKLVFSDHLRLQYPSLRERFGRIHEAYSARLCAVLDRAKAEGAVSGSLASKDAATMFLSLIQGLGFQFAIARLPIALVPEAERMLANYLQAITAAGDAVEHARAIVDTLKRDFSRRQRDQRRKKKIGKLVKPQVQSATDPRLC